MDNRVLKKLRKAEIEILDEIERVCKKHNIKYFLMFGTLLGAVRHQGFIPWDDDIDIGMTREDYDKFMQIAPKELNEKYHLDYINTNKNYYLPFMKVRNKETLFEEETSLKYDGPKGIWVDIFPYDYIKKNKLSKLTKIKVKFIFLLYETLAIRNLKAKTSSKLAQITTKLMSNKLNFKLIDLLIKEKKKTENIVYYNFRGMKHVVIFNKKDIFPLTTIDFEDKKYAVPKNYKTVLKKLYGKDYMQLPPIEQRESHNPKKVIFEDGEKFEF